MDDGEQQMAMQTDISRVAAYGWKFPETFVGFKFDGPTVVALFTELEPHQCDLPPLLQHPERVRVETSPHSRAQLERTSGDVVRFLLHRAPGAVQRISLGLTDVDVLLLGDEAALAAALYERFGSASRVRVDNRDVDADGNAVGPDLRPRTV